jgi:hypothetical protein
MRKLKMRRHVARRENGFLSMFAIIVGFYSLFVELDARFFEV